VGWSVDHGRARKTQFEEGHGTQPILHAKGKGAVLLGVRELYIGEKGNGLAD